MKKLRAYLKSRKYKASGQPSSGGDANADLNQPILGNGNSGTAPKGQQALSVSKKKPNAGKSGTGAFLGKGVLDDEALHSSAKGLKGGPVKKDGSQTSHNAKGPNPQKLPGKSSTQFQGNQKGLNWKGPNPLKGSKGSTD